MIFEYHTASKPTRIKNDDIAGFEGRTFWLMDGATQLFDPEHGKDASWHVGRLDAVFRSAVAKTPDIDLKTLAKNAIEDVAEEFFEESGLTKDAAQDLRPFSSLILCRTNESQGWLKYFTISDSKIAILGADRETIIYDKRVEEGNYLVQTDALLWQGHGFNSDSYRKAMRNVYDVIAATLNTPSGFYVVGQDSSVVDHALTGEVQIDPDDDILLMSDGFTRAVDTLNLYPSWTDLLRALKTEGGEHVIRKIRETEAADSNGQKYPRSSPHDDATLLWLRPGI